MNRFSYIDYGVFSLMLIFSAAIGFYYAYKERNKKNVDQVLLGGRKLSIFPVAMSIMASFTSAISILGFPQEMYLFGSMYWLIGISYFFTQPFAAIVYVPFFHNLKITSAYEYLEKRFNNYVRIAASIIFCIQMFLYMSVVLYTPAVAVQQVTGISLWISILVTGIVCTVYTSLGGMKAVVFTDTFQVFVMFAGLIAIIIEGTIRVGGFSVIWERAENTTRLELFDFDPSPFKRHTFWSIMIGGFFTSLTVYGSNQATIQRYLSVPSVRDAQIAMYLNLIGTFSILCICCLCGFVAFAFFYGCDPFLDNKKISKYDQILPYLVMELLKDFHGLPGLFIACVYSAALSSVSSGLNSLTAVCLHDFIYPVYFHYKKVRMDQNKSMMLSKILAALFGTVTICLAYLCYYLSDTVLQVSLSIFGLLGGPLLGVISLGMFVPFANSYGAFIGLIASLGVNFWLGIGSILYGDKSMKKPFTQHLCLNISNSSHFISSSKIPNTGFNLVYNISYYWYSLIAIIIVFFFGIVISLMTNRNNGRVYDENLFFQFKYISKKNSKYSKKKVLDKNFENEMIEKVPITNDLENPIE